jgi:hypothetical protein
VCLRGTFITGRCDKETKRQRCYGKFKESKKFKEYEIDERWEALKALVRQRDGNKCQAMNTFSIEEAKEFIAKPGQRSLGQGSLGGLDCAHIVSRAIAPMDDLYYNSDNVVLIDRLFHKRLDEYKSPVTGESINKEDRDNWWKRIIGEPRWNRLQELYRRLTCQKKN